MRQPLVLALILFLVTTGSAQAQCTIAAYSNPEGTWNYGTFEPFQPTDVYVVLFTEDTVSGVAYRLEVSGYWYIMYLQFVSYGPSGRGIGLTRPANGSPDSADLTVGLGECAVGFGGLPVVVAKYTFVPANVAARGPQPELFVEVTANTSEHPDLPVYSNCIGAISTCEPGPRLDLYQVAVQAASMGEIKALYD